MNRSIIPFDDVQSQKSLKMPSQRKFVARSRRETSVDTALIQKGLVLARVRESVDMQQAVRDRLCLWPTGDEIVCLLMMLQSQQITPSYRPGVSQLGYIPTPPPVENEKMGGSRKSSKGAESVTSAVHSRNSQMYLSPRGIFGPKKLKSGLQIKFQPNLTPQSKSKAAVTSRGPSSANVRQASRKNFFSKRSTHAFKSRRSMVHQTGIRRHSLMNGHDNSLRSSPLGIIDPESPWN
ncbi:unnamed protein product [Lymnaea stagnalis]|uniref:Uncharacterized protein n=1 Tax=Lymnaea stagnalis TaxID=6523 RepID=A0AAV2H3V1_LYMST